MSSKEASTIHLGTLSFQLEYPIMEAFELEDRVIVLFQPDAYKEKFGQFRNLVALAPDGRRLWTAELPTHESGDRYYKVASRSPLVAYSTQSWEVQLDPTSGRITARSFFK